MSRTMWILGAFAIGSGLVITLIAGANSYSIQSFVIGFGLIILNEVSGIKEKSD